MINSKEVKEGTSSQSKVKEGGGCECPTPNGDVIQVCKYKPSHITKVSLAFSLMNRFGLITVIIGFFNNLLEENKALMIELIFLFFKEIAEIQELMFLLCDPLLI
ncbi:hypothetical protein Bca52824_074408 [Brassica carinata]|uniref:Uncharacterized protein n=1 Tax=Brassica carinata TaxID=52824 RepID=A0A8X7PT19_BRACI|nr:hypothetical protein Bca52824_074408 [Brassica carinata]